MICRRYFTACCDRIVTPHSLCLSLSLSLSQQFPYHPLFIMVVVLSTAAFVGCLAGSVLISEGVRHCWRCVANVGREPTSANPERTTVRYSDDPPRVLQERSSTENDHLLGIGSRVFKRNSPVPEMIKPSLFRECRWCREKSGVVRTM
uniref:Uncharacterized protein n=1 Tax=Spongospora subterranea TaxID=70186 RepID=A0A0H5QGK8_9EUKA|eukprot:CRZ01095.1 hypothetical protein [Spongospora subterranea]